MNKGTTQTKTETSNVTRDPYAPAVPALQGLIAGATNAFQSGAGQGVYQGDRTAGLGDTTQSGLDYLTNNASAGLGTAQAGDNYLMRLLGMGGQTAGTQGAADAYSGIGSVDTAPTAGILGQMTAPGGLTQTVANRLGQGDTVTTEADLRGVLAANQGPTQAQSSLQGVADGKYLNGPNPYLDDMVSRATANAASQVGQRMAASGRYGSGSWANATADATSAAENALRYQNYSDERTRQAQAASAIDSASNARAGIQQGILNLIGSGQAQNASLAAQGAQLGMAGNTAALGAAGQLASQQATNANLDATRAQGLAGIASADRAAAMSGLSAVPTLQSALQAPGRILTQAGGIEDAARQDQITADMARFSEEQSAPWRGLNLYGGIINPIASLGGTTAGTSTAQTYTPAPSLMQQILGGASAGIGLLGQTGAFSTTGAGGAVTPGYLTPMLTSMFSDERVKEDVEPVGKLNDGQTVYAYRYKGDPRPQIGLLAQEVMRHQPGAVGQTPQGILTVDYGKATREAAQVGRRR